MTTRVDFPQPFPLASETLSDLVMGTELPPTPKPAATSPFEACAAELKNDTAPVNLTKNESVPSDDASDDDIVPGEEIPKEVDPDSDPGDEPSTPDEEVVEEDDPFEDFDDEDFDDEFDDDFEEELEDDYEIEPDDSDMFPPPASEDADDIVDKDLDAK